MERIDTTGYELKNTGVLTLVLVRTGRTGEEKSVYFVMPTTNELDENSE